MPNYLDLSASVSVSMTELIGAKPEPEPAQEVDKEVEA